MRITSLLLFLAIFQLTGCGTFSPIPSHGGGKRFAVEQVLVSSSMRRAIADIPLKQLQGKKILLDTSIINDEGGGSLNGARPYLSASLGLQGQQTNSNADSSSVAQQTIGAVLTRSDSMYIKDASFNNSDSKQFSNLLASALVRHNIMLNPVQATEGDPDYFVEVIVDVLGSWRSRTDWIVNNQERLRAIVSLEYVITPYGANLGKRQIVGIPDDRDRSFRRIVTDDSDLS